MLTLVGLKVCSNLSLFFGRKSFYECLFSRDLPRSSAHCWLLNYQLGSQIHHQTGPNTKTSNGILNVYAVQHMSTTSQTCWPKTTKIQESFGTTSNPGKRTALVYPHSRKMVLLIVMANRKQTFWTTSSRQYSRMKTQSTAQHCLQVNPLCQCNPHQHERCQETLEQPQAS